MHPETPPILHVKNCLNRFMCLQQRVTETWAYLPDLPATQATEAKGLLRPQALKRRSSMPMKEKLYAGGREAQCWLLRSSVLMEEKLYVSWGEALCRWWRSSMPMEEKFYADGGEPLYRWGRSSMLMGEKYYACTRNQRPTAVSVRETGVHERAN